MGLNRQERRRAERLAAKAAAKARHGGGARAASVEFASELVELGRHDDADKVLRAVIEAESTNAPALALLSKVLRLRGRLDEAVAYARRAIARDQQSASGHVALGEALRLQDRVFEAMESLERALSLSPADAEAHHAYGAAHIDLGNPSAAVDHFRRALELAPEYVGYANSLGIALSRLGNHEEALPLFGEVLRHDPDAAEVRFNRSLCLLATERLAQGWADYESGFASKGRQPNRSFSVPRWDGRPLPAGQRLLVWREQGIGDEIRLASCYRDVLELAPDAIIEAEPRLVGLFRRSFPTATVRTPTCDDAGNPTQDPDFHAHIAAGSLPGLFRRAVEDFPTKGSYLVADPRRTDEFRRRLDELGPGLKVGIFWRSMRLDVKRLQWYTTLEEWTPVLSVPGIRFVNLQYGAPELLESELREQEARTSVPVAVWDDVDYTNDLESVAGLISALDLVIGVSTSVSLLGGALGKPVLQLGLAGDPMQFGQLDAYPWFPTVRPVNRQPGQTWVPVMQQVASLLRDASERR